MNERRAELYQRLMESEDRIARAAYAHGISDAEVQAALDTAEERLTPEERREDLYLASLRHFVAALGGRLELRAVLGDQAVVIRREPR